MSLQLFTLGENRGTGRTPEFLANLELPRWMLFSAVFFKLFCGLEHLLTTAAANLRVVLKLVSSIGSFSGVIMLGELVQFKRGLFPECPFARSTVEVTTECPSFAVLR